MAGGPLARQKSEASKRGWMALGGVVVTAMQGWSVVFGGGSFFLLLILGAVSAWLVKRWFGFRAKWGMRF